MHIHKKKIIDAAIDGLIEGGFKPQEAEVFRSLLERMYDCGYNEAYHDLQPNKSNMMGCPACGIGTGEISVGYVCNQQDCPLYVKVS